VQSLWRGAEVEHCLPRRSGLRPGERRWIHPQRLWARAGLPHSFSPTIRSNLLIVRDRAGCTFCRSSPGWRASRISWLKSEVRFSAAFLCVHTHKMLSSGLERAWEAASGSLLVDHSALNCLMLPGCRHAPSSAVAQSRPGGPALQLELAPRLNLITGDHSLGKSFLLDVAW